uniref:Hexosyltransferase n=1 Tax=Timema genevievae TaxID=629358 RepID=A0A7R9JS06_TIMGE|nr:unnamed protein product [Timema genevievae]
MSRNTRQAGTGRSGNMSRLRNTWEEYGIVEVTGGNSARIATLYKEVTERFKPVSICRGFHRRRQLGDEPTNPSLSALKLLAGYGLVYIIKSAMENFNKRMAIRHSWGFEKRFSDVPIRTVFVLGVHESNKKLQFMVQDEQRKFDDVKLFAGFVFVSAPHRHRSSKWYVRLSEYPYHMWPPYVTAGAYILSHDALVDMYYGSLYTQHFRFDDIYLGLVAKKVDLEPFHCSEFYFYKKEYNVHSYRYVIASHGFSDPDELLRIWNEQRSAGNA